MHDSFLQLQFHSALSTLLAGEKPATFTVALSGGADSMALILLAAPWAKEHGWQCEAVTVDHGLRPESAAEATQVAGWMKERGIPHTTLTWEGVKPTSNIQAAAREKRYALLSEYCAQKGHRHLLLAHHRGDQAETVLMRLLRGSGLRGLQGMQAKAAMNGIQWLRPLLGVPKAALTAFLEAEGQKWIEDPSNQKEAYDRVWIRNLLASHRDSAVLETRLVRTAGHLARSYDYLRVCLQKEWQEGIRLSEWGFLSFTREWFAGIHEEAQVQCLAEAFRLIGGAGIPPRFDSLAGMREALLSGEDSFRRSLHGCLLHARKKEVFLYREPEALPPRVAALSTTLWDRFACHTPDAEGMEIGALGKAGWASLPHKNTPASLPAAIFYGLPALWHLEKLVAAPHIGYNEGAKKENMRCDFIPQCRFFL